MELSVGAVLDGKVKSITKFGAFISLADNKTGMVHISEIAHAYVSDIHEYLSEGQDVKVMVISLEPAGKINLSIKRTQTPPQAERRETAHPQQQVRPARSAAPKAPPTFEEKLKAFMSESDSKIAGLRQYSDHKTRSRRR